MQVMFGAKFRKLPSTIEAVRQDQPFTMPKPASWGQEGLLEGQAGDYKVKNHTSGEEYPLSADVLPQKYEHVEGDTYRTRQDKPVIAEGRLPKDGETTIQTHEGPVETSVDGIPSVIMTDNAGEFPLAGKNFLKFYEAEAGDEEAQGIVALLKRLLPGEQ